MDRVDLDRLEALHRAATPGPWRATDKAVWTAPDEAGHYAAFDGVVAQCVDGYVTADAALIAAARNALPALLSRLRALEEVARAAGDVAQTGAVLSCIEDPADGYRDDTRQWFGDACAACEHEDCAHVRSLATLRAALAAAKEGA